MHLFSLYLSQEHPWVERPEAGSLDRTCGILEVMLVCQLGPFPSVNINSTSQEVVQEVGMAATPNVPCCLEHPLAVACPSWLGAPAPNFHWQAILEEGMAGSESSPSHHPLVAGQQTGIIWMAHTSIGLVELGGRWKRVCCGLLFGNGSSPSGVMAHGAPYNFSISSYQLLSRHLLQKM